MEGQVGNAHRVASLTTWLLKFKIMKIKYN